MQYTSIERILSKFHRETSQESTSETYLIDLIGESLEFLQVFESQEQCVAFMEVKDFHCDVPMYLNSVLQIARYNNWQGPTETTAIEICPSGILSTLGSECSCEIEEVSDEVSCNNTLPLPSDCIITDCQGNIIGDYEKVYYRPFFDLKWEHSFWCDTSFYREKFTPVRLANHTFYNTIVNKEKIETPYENYTDEYTIVGTTDRRFRFSFKEGLVAISFIRTALDVERGLPLIPDNISYITAITYYIKWKLAETDFDSNREGSGSKVDYYEKRWLKYVKQAKNYMKMPKTIDQYQNLLEQSYYLIPRHRRYYGFFGKLGREENRIFNDPNRRNFTI